MGLSDANSRNCWVRIVSTDLLVPAGTEDSRVLMAIIERASTASDFSIDRLTQLLELKERWDAVEARKAYCAAMAAFKSNPPRLTKNKHVAFGNTSYNHATHDEVSDKVAAALARVGITHAWAMRQSETDIFVTCWLTHVAGHRESAVMSCAYDKSGGKNLIQAVASANSYMQRYTLLAVTGLSTSDMPNDDGRAMGIPDDEAPAIHADVWQALVDAAAMGNADLQTQWLALSNDCRRLIVTHYATRWQTLKSVAAGNTNQREPV